MKRILGISGLYHDAAAALVEEGRLVAAVQEERLSRVKHDPAFPRRAIGAVLELSPGPVDAVVFYDQPVSKFGRLLDTWAAIAPAGLPSFLAAVPEWMRSKLWVPHHVESTLAGLGWPSAVPCWFPAHHESHAASAYYPSPFGEAAILTVDGVGEWATTAISHGRGAGIEMVTEIRYPHSLGLLYSAFTAYCGFAVNDGEYRVMGLAATGTPRYERLIRDHLIDLREDGSFRLNLAFFNYVGGLTMTNARFHALFGGPPRREHEPLDGRHADLARSVQAVLEDALLRQAREAHRLTGSANLCLAGGVELNCVANARIVREGPFREVWIQPAAGDAGGAAGAAWFGWHRILGNPRAGRESGDGMGGALLGPAWTDEPIGAWLASRGIHATLLAGAARHGVVADLLAAGRVIGLLRGRMEFGPRALGNRSILADPRPADMQARVNTRIKFREEFRPFAPAVLAGRAGEFFDLHHPSPYMLLTAPVRPGPGLPAVTHADGSARVQTVDPGTHPEFHALLSAFAERTGCPVLLNTSFNLRDEPIVCSPADAYDCFMRSGLDALVLESWLVEREAR